MRKERLYLPSLSTVDEIFTTSSIAILTTEKTETTIDKGKHVGVKWSMLAQWNLYDGVLVPNLKV